jgi:predicted component of type VI protein secretion system
VRKLTVASGPAQGRSVEVESELVVGRENADFNLDDPEASRRHAAVRPLERGVEVEDLGSLNGTFVNGRRIEGPETLTMSGLMRVGTTEITVELSFADVTQPRAAMQPPAEGPPDEAEPAAIPEPDVTAPRAIPEPDVTAPRAIPEPDVTAPRAIPEPDVTAPRKIPEPDVTAPRAIPEPDVTAPRAIPEPAPDVTAPRAVQDAPAGRPARGGQPILVGVIVALAILVIVLLVLLLA